MHIFNNYIKSKLKIGFAIVLSFILVKLVANEIFVSGSPLVRQNLGAYLTSRISSIFSSNNNNKQPVLANYYDQTVKELSNIPFTQVSKGVYAKSNGNKSITVTYVDQVPTTTYTFVIRGKTYKIYVPVDSKLTKDQVKQAVEQWQQ